MELYDAGSTGKPPPAPQASQRPAYPPTGQRNNKNNSNECDHRDLNISNHDHSIQRQHVPLGYAQDQRRDLHVSSHTTVGLTTSETTTGSPSLVARSGGEFPLGSPWTPPSGARAGAAVGAYRETAYPLKVNGNPVPNGGISLEIAEIPRTGLANNPSAATLEGSGAGSEASLSTRSNGKAKSKKKAKVAAKGEGVDAGGANVAAKVGPNGKKRSGGGGKKSQKKGSSNSRVEGYKPLDDSELCNVCMSGDNHEGNPMMKCSRSEFVLT